MIRICAALALAAVGGCASAPEPGTPITMSQSKPAAAPPPLTTCPSPVATVIVIEAQPESAGMMGGMGGMGEMGSMRGDLYSRLQIRPLVQIARGLADRSGCFRTLESDPALLAMPGGVQPEIVLRVRASALSFVERSLADKASGAVKRYIGRYTGGGTESEPDILQKAEVSLEFVCPRQRQVIRSFQGVAEGTFVEPAEDADRGEAIRNSNREHVGLAYTRAQDAALVFLRAKSRPCE